MLLSLLSLLAAPKNAITYSIHSRMVFLENFILNIVSGHERFAPQALWNEQSQHLSVASALPRAYQALQINVQASISLQAAGMSYVQNASMFLSTVLDTFHYNFIHFTIS